MQDGDLYALYLSSTDAPIILDNVLEGAAHAPAADSVLPPALKLDARCMEQRQQLGTRWLVARNLLLNPFVPEDKRQTLFQKVAQLETGRELMSDVCHEAFLEQNAKFGFDTVVARTKDLIDWKAVQGQVLSEAVTEFLKGCVSGEELRHQVKQRLEE